MAKTKTYTVAEGYSITAMGTIYEAGAKICEDVFADKTFLAKLVSKKMILADSEEEFFESKEKADAEAKVESQGKAKTGSGK